MTAEEADKKQDWAGMDGAIAWHLIDRHADNWNEAGAMMNAWLRANSPTDTAQHGRDEALHQVAVLREALSAYPECGEYFLEHLDATQLRKQALSEIPPVGVLCESEPVAYMNVKGDMTFLHGPYNADDIPLYRKKE